MYDLKSRYLDLNQDIKASPSANSFQHDLKRSFLKS